MEAELEQAWPGKPQHPTASMVVLRKTSQGSSRAQGGLNMAPTAFQRTMAFVQMSTCPLSATSVPVLQRPGRQHAGGK